MVPTKCPNMFSGRVEACPCPEFQNKFPNLYLEPMQYNNPDGKWSEEIPYMIINLEHDKDIYLGKDIVDGLSKGRGQIMRLLGNQ